MRLLTFAAGSGARLGAVVGDKAVDLLAAYETIPAKDKAGPVVLPLDMLSFLWSGRVALSAARQVVEIAEKAHEAGDILYGNSGEVAEFELDSVRVLAPIARPGKIICLGLNYADHIAETHATMPTAPILFPKFANAIVGPGDPIVLPKASTQVDYEAELAVVIGRLARNVSLEDAYDYVAGYTILNDVSARDLQQETSQWMRGKSVDGFAPTGPYLVTGDEAGDPQAFDVRLWVNGDLRQSSNTKNLIFNVPYLVHHISKTMTLEPGDIISTGTPNGVGMAMNPPAYLKAGDVVRIEIGDLGVLENPVVDEG